MDTHLTFPRSPSSKTLARRVLAGERFVTGLLLVLWGVCGIVATVARIALPSKASDLGSVLAGVGCMISLLKGIEILLRLYTAESDGAEASSPTASAADSRSTPVRDPRGLPGRRKRGGRRGIAPRLEHTIRLPGLVVNGRPG